MKNLLIILALIALIPINVLAEDDIALQSANVDLTDQAALQRGAKYFMNYCSGCHSLRYARYNRMAKDIGLTEKQVQDNLMFVSGTKIGDNITIAMPEDIAVGWFGQPTPDLTLEIRTKDAGADWVYTYIKSFYRDDKRPLGVNNTVWPNVGMPDVLWQLRGMQTAVYKDSVDAAGNPVKVFDHFARTGGISDEKFDGVARDLTTFLTYMSDPVKLEREALGRWVILFLLVFTVLAYMLKKEYWLDVEH